MNDMNNDNNNAFTRRMFLQQGLTLASMMTTVPWFIQQSAFGMMRPLGSQTTSQPGVPEDRILVVVQLGGGNDGLNTVVPFGDANYYRMRPTLSVPAPGQSGNGGNAALSFDDKAGIGLHPSMSGFKELIDEGVASVVQGVGYPNPNRSHFTSMDIWHTASTDATGNGWLGRYYDNCCAGSPETDHAVAVGRTAPLALIGDQHKPVSFESADLFRWIGADLHDDLEQPYQKLNRTGAVGDVDEDSQLAFLMRTALDAQVSSDQIREAVSKRPLVPYPGGSLSQQLQVVSAMIRAELPTRVYYVSLGGFDTHATQANQHANLLRQVGDSLNSFYKDIKKQGNSSRVLTMVFSEFGRRVAQNASGGTDHGTAAPMYFIGDQVRPGLLGQHPSLVDLDQGDLRFNVDFRCLYTAVLADWMKANPKEILGGTYRKAEILSST